MQWYSKLYLCLYTEINNSSWPVTSLNIPDGLPDETSLPLLDSSQSLAPELLKCDTYNNEVTFLRK
jgi:hypothetical protein